MNPAPADPLAALLADVAVCDSAFRLMERLMRFCRDQAAAYRAWGEHLARQAELPAARADAGRVVAGFGGVVFTADDPPELVDPIRAAVAEYVRADRPPPVVRAGLLLAELDRELTPKLRPLYPDYHSGPLAPGQLFPVYWPDLKRNGWLPPDRLSTAPRSLAQPPGFLPQWELAPPAEAFAGRDVEFRFAGRADVSPPIAGPLKLAVGVLNASAEELTFDLVTESPPRFRDVRPRPDLRDAQVAALCRLATRAAGEGVRVLVFPELCIDRAGAETVFAHVEALPSPPALVVMGSHHWTDGADRRNTSTALRRGTAAPLSHHKMTRYTHTHGGQAYQEDIATGNVIRVFVGSDWSLVLLICRDFLDPAVLRLVERLRPTFLCVPSFSGISTPFVAPVGALAANAQTVTVFANGPVPADRVVGAFGVPRVREQPAGGASLSREGIAPEPLPQLPCLVVYDGSADRTTVLPC